MKRVFGIALFFFGIGLVTGFFIGDQMTRCMVCMTCWIAGYCLFFR